ncbi:MAG: multicopper oxidase domain-containing protein [Clostridia bacterium]|nr:multicopper oxidase domain-containing protein [Clostridia bacterium]
MHKLGSKQILLDVMPHVARNPVDVPPPITRSKPNRVHIELIAKEVIAEVAPGKNFLFWTFALPGEKPAVPSPMIRVMEGDIVEVTLTNAIESIDPHNLDFHAVMGPGGGAAVTNVQPGETKTFSFKALRAGAYIYHCAGEGMPWEHVAHGMYGLIMVEPRKGLPRVDKEFYVGQSEWYLSPAAKRDPKITDPKVRFYDLDETKAFAEHPDLFTLNGHTQALTHIWQNMLTHQGQKARIFFVTGGPNIGSNFHVIGQIFDRVILGSPETPVKNAETIYVAPGSAAVFELTTLVPGKYLLVDHALWRVPKGALGYLHVEKTGPWPHDIYSPETTESGH